MAAAAPVSSGGIVPAQLGFLALFNPSLGDTDETIDDQIVYYASVTAQSSSHRRKRARGRPMDGVSHEERNERLRQIGLAQGMINFSRDFADGAPVDAIDTERSRVVIHELEPGWWILASIDLNKLPLPPRLPTTPGENQEERYEFSTKEIKPTCSILSDLLRAHTTFLLHHDSSLTSLFERTKRRNFVSVLGRYWDLFLSTWSVMVHGNPSRTVFGGINIAASGELGVGVGEEERGSGEREVLEGLVGRVEGLVDLVVSKFGEDESMDPKPTRKTEQSTTPWLGSGREPSADDGAIFLGTGVLTRKSLCHLTHWMEDLYSWGEQAYGVIDSPISVRRARAAKPSKSTDPNLSKEPTPIAEQQSTQPTEPTKQPTEPTKQPTEPPKPTEPIEHTKAAEPKEPTKPEELREPTKPAESTNTTEQIIEAGKNPAPKEGKAAEDGKLDKMVSYLKLGYGSYWTIPGVPAGTGGTSDASWAPKEEAVASNNAPRPSAKRQLSSDGAAGHYLIGLKGDIEEGDTELDGDEGSDSFEQEHNSRTLLRTVHVEMQLNDKALAENENEVFTDKLRVVVYVNRPFIFVFLFRLRTDSLAWDALYRSLHYQLAPLRKSLLASTTFRPDRPDAGSGIRDIIWNPEDLTVHCTVPNISDYVVESVGPLAPPPRSWWSRADAVNTHLHILSIYAATRSLSTTEIERTQKTSRGWWVVWTRQRKQQQVVMPEQTSSSRPSTSHSRSIGEEGSEHEASRTEKSRVETPSKEIILIRRAGDHARSGSLGSVSSSATGGAIETAGKLAQGIGVDTRRYIEDLLSML